MLLYCKSVVLKCYECLPEILKRPNSIINLYVSSVSNYTINCYYGTNKIKEKNILSIPWLLQNPLWCITDGEKNIYDKIIIKTSFIKNYSEKRPNAMLNDNKK